MWFITSTKGSYVFGRDGLSICMKFLPEVVSIVGSLRDRERGEHVREGPMKGQFYGHFCHEIYRSSN